MKRRLRFKRYIKDTIKQREFVGTIADYAGVSIPTIKYWIDTDNIKLYSYTLTRHIAILLGTSIDNLFQK